MTVNITQNALGSKLDIDLSRTSGQKQSTNKAPEQQVLNKLSSGVSLPERNLNNQNLESYQQDSSEVSEKATNLSSSRETNFSEITTMQEEVGKLDDLQTALESVSKSIWAIDEQVSSAQAVSQEAMSATSEELSQDVAAEATEIATEPVEIDIAPAPTEAEREEMQQIVDRHLEGIDQTGRQLLDYLSNFKESYMSELDVSTSSFGRPSEDSPYSLSSLSGEVALTSNEASEIVAKAKEDVASLQVSTEMHRSNTLNDIGKALTTATSELERPDMSRSIENSVQEVSKILKENPSAISEASQIDASQVAGLLL